ncbi:DUF1330 domain-containing protein [uncultured Tolumonas sp.]|uniref:DUF1330 domain-containing protein n=1 Tax=uncultured Tolumonas sp. TaxID=263765 RepID=UPI002A0A22F6|nr:DUF1330 domain-containing protein [uncultured Tolumonas sp.]
MENQKPAFFIFDSKITNIEALAPYIEKVEETYKPFGGKLIVQGGKLEVFEGYAPQGIIVVLRFDNMEKAKAWYASDSYQAIISYRHAGAQANGWLVEGLAETI